jgi:hypothetical protein
MIYFYIHVGIANDDGVIDKSEFVILCMVRTGAANPDLIKLILAHFADLDVDGDGGLDISEICRDLSKSSKRRSSLDQTFQRAVKRASKSHSNIVLHMADLEESPDDNKESEIVSANTIKTPFDVSSNGGHTEV